MSRLRELKPRVSVGTLCSLFGKSRQAYHQFGGHSCKARMSEEIVLEIIGEIRSSMPRVGGRKLHMMINDGLPPELRVGRDALFDILYRHDLLVKQRVRRVRTTFSNHWMRKYPNIIKGIRPSRPNQIWVADITYIRTENSWVYLHLVTDAYSKMIVGWCVGPTLEARYTISALKMALKNNSDGLKGLIHHSDRGCQYCSEGYVKLLQDNGILISMCETGDPKENAVAERVNGILKMEWLNHETFRDINEVTRKVKDVVNIYNNNRPHLSLNYKTPQYVRDNPDTDVRPRWRNYYPQADISNEVTIS